MNLRRNVDSSSKVIASMDSLVRTQRMGRMNVISFILRPARNYSNMAMEMEDALIKKSVVYVM